MAPVKTMKTKKEFQKLLREASEGSSSSSASSSPWLTYGKYLVVLFIGSVLLGYLMGDGLIQTQVDKQFNLTVAGHSCQQVWQSLKSFQDFQALNENSIYLNTSTDPIKIPDYLSSIGLDATEVLDMSAMSDQYRSECGEQATRNQCQKEEYIMYGEYFEWVPEWMKTPYLSLLTVNNAFGVVQASAVPPMAKDAGTLFEIRSVHWTRAMVMFLIRTDGLVLLSDDDASKSCSIQDSLTLNVPKMFYSQTIFEIESQKAQVHNNLQKKFSRTK